MMQLLTEKCPTVKSLFRKFLPLTLLHYRLSTRRLHGNGDTRNTTVTAVKLWYWQGTPRYYLGTGLCCAVGMGPMPLVIPQ